MRFFFCIVYKIPRPIPEFSVEGMAYTYDQANRLLTRDNLITGDYYEYGYDSRGNLTGDADRTYEYDAQDRLVKVTD